MLFVVFTAQEFCWCVVVVAISTIVVVGVTFDGHAAAIATLRYSKLASRQLGCQTGRFGRYSSPVKNIVKKSRPK